MNETHTFICMKEKRLENAMQAREAGSMPSMMLDKLRSKEPRTDPGASEQL